MDAMLERIAANKAELDRLRPSASGGSSNLEHTADLELTYTSNAIEGNMLNLGGVCERREGCAVRDKRTGKARRTVT